ncbi:MAG: hypothetical protein HN348_07425 [Proteobacteria bacterium]|nr:hypothetical protein [Pseudomonadota bacterium]
MMRFLVAAAIVACLPYNAWATGDDLVLGKATVEQLAALDHVNHDQAQSIVTLAAQRGRLSSVEELRVLPGMGEETLASLRSSTVVEVEFPSGAKKNYGSADEVLAEFSHEPDIQQVQQWAMDYASLSPETVRRWLRASKTFAALPQITFDYRLRDGWDQGFEYTNADGESAPSAPEDDHFPVLDNAGSDQDSYYYVKARWDLNELVMSSERIRVINEAQDVVKLRDKVLSEVTRLYFERRRVQVEMLLSPKRDTMGQVKEQLRLMELTAGLDSVTGGSFSQNLAKTSTGSASAPPAKGGVDL